MRMKSLPGDNSEMNSRHKQHEIAGKFSLLDAYRKHVFPACGLMFSTPIRVCSARWRVKRAPVEGMDLAF